MDLVVVGLPVYHGLPLFIDVSVCSPISAAGLPHHVPGANESGSRWESVVARKIAHYPEVASSGVASFAVLVAEVYGRCSDDVLRLLRELAFHRAAAAPALLRRSVALAWYNRWWSVVACALGRGVAGCYSHDQSAHEFRQQHVVPPTLDAMLSDLWPLGA